MYIYIYIYIYIFIYALHALPLTTLYKMTKCNDKITV